MKLALLLFAASNAAAFVIPDQQLLSEFRRESLDPDAVIPSHISNFGDLLAGAEHYMFYAAEVSESIHVLGCGDIEDVDDLNEELAIQEGPPHHKPPHHKPPHHKPKPEDPHHGKPNLTIYEMIKASNHTTIFAELVSEFDDIVKRLNSTSANYTLFVPIDEAFAKFKHHPKPPKEYLKKFVTYHISEQLYPARRIFFSRTIPTLLEQDELGPYPQRISTQFGPRGLSLNFLARIVKSNLVSLSCLSLLP
jgi:hypothetical protein